MRSAALSWIALALAVLVGLTGWAGLFWPPTYAQETRASALGAIASDVVDLFVIVPLLLVSGFAARRGSMAARFICLGALGYLLYNFLIYCFLVRFNPLFLVYCATLGLAFYGFIGGVLSLAPAEVAARYASRPARTPTALVFLAMAVATTAQWLRDIVPALAARRLPQWVAETGSPINPIWVLDLCFLLPALAITGVSLLRKRPLGFVLAPILLTVLALISSEIIVIRGVMERAGVPQGYGGTVFIAALGTLFTVLLVVFLRAGTSARRTAGAAPAGSQEAPHAA
jgi:hypothetical protein